MKALQRFEAPVWGICLCEARRMGWIEVLRESSQMSDYLCMILMPDFYLVVQQCSAPEIADLTASLCQTHPGNSSLWPHGWGNAFI